MTDVQLACGPFPSLSCLARKGVCARIEGSAKSELKRPQREMEPQEHVSCFTSESFTSLSGLLSLSSLKRDFNRPPIRRPANRELKKDFQALEQPSPGLTLSHPGTGNEPAKNPSIGGREKGRVGIDSLGDSEKVQTDPAPIRPL